MVGFREKKRVASEDVSGNPRIVAGAGGFGREKEVMLGKGAGPVAGKHPAVK